MRISIEDEKRDGKEEFKNFDMAEYSKATFGMYQGTKTKVKIRFANYMCGVFIDRFGKDISIRKVKEENIMGLFDIDDEKLQALYHRALVEEKYGFVNPRKYPYLDRAIMQYARENGCSYDQALILAKTGNKMF